MILAGGGRGWNTGVGVVPQEAVDRLSNLCGTQCSIARRRRRSMLKAITTVTVTVVFSLVSSAAQPAPADPPRLLRTPTLSQTQIAFAFAGDLWIVGRDGGEARRLTTGVGEESGPLFSPDGQMIAFTGEYDGNVDVYVVPAAGGVPRRLTYHPGSDRVAGWTPDGKRVLFRSSRNNTHGFSRLFTIPLDGAWPTEVPLPMAEEASYSPDAARLAYMPLGRRFTAWKRYRGGTAAPIWIARLVDSSIEKIPRTDSNDFNPMWVEDTVYFLSDRGGPVSLYAYDTKTKKVSRVLENDGLDLKSAAAGPGAIVYEQFGTIHLFDLKSGKARPVPIHVTGDLPEVRPRFEKAAPQVREFSLSPTGARAVFEARGEIITVPAEKGDARNLTNSAAVAERDPAWSPDGKSLAYFSDESGEYALHVRDQNGRGEVRKIPLGNPPTFYYSPMWSPDGKKIAFSDRRLNLWTIDLEQRRPVRVDTSLYDSTWWALAWSPDSRWLAYTRLLPNKLNAVFVHDLSTGQNHQITDGMSDTVSPMFDPNGKYLYFAASTDAGAARTFIDMSAIFDRPVTRSLYVVVLQKDQPSPLAPESDEEKGAEKKEEGKDAAADGGKTEAKDGEKKPEEKKEEKKPEPVRIDMEGIDQRVLALPIPPRNYTGFALGKTGILFLAESTPVPVAGVQGRTLHKFELKTRKTEKFLDGVDDFTVSRNGEKMLTRKGNQFAIIATEKPPAGDSGALKLDTVEIPVDPVAEWRQMYREVWRIERDFFYDPNYHGLNLTATAAKYAPYLDGIASREDLNYLFEEMLGELSVGHLFVGGGSSPEVKRVRGGLLGADYAIENGRYRFSRVYSGENWNPQLRAPLTQPGVNVKAGEYLLAVNDRPVRATDNLYRFFEGTADKQVVLRVGPNADETGSREVTVVPVESERGLRHLAWIEGNRRKVDQMSGGRLAYVYLPDTGQGGYTAFNRYYFAQTDREGAVIDERFNGGGVAADYIVDHLRRPLLNYWSPRYGKDVTTPGLTIFGPKAMIINEYAGSGGDLMPWYFRRLKIGPLIGKRTWGGLVGIGGYPSLLDGGGVTAPHFAFWNPDGTWDVENHGVDPDIEVEMDPKAWRQGKDPQLEKAVEVVMEALRRNPLPKHQKPAYPNYHAGSSRAAR
jgi:tricorn protease